MLAATPPPGWEWLGQLPAQAVQQILKHYVRAWDRFFKGMARPPKFKKRSGSMAVDIPQASKLNIVRLNHRLGEVTIPLIGRVRFRWTRPLAGISPGYYSVDSPPLAVPPQDVGGLHARHG
jgi:putative transposase